MQAHGWIHYGDDLRLSLLQAASLSHISITIVYPAEATL